MNKEQVIAAIDEARLSGQGKLLPETLDYLKAFLTKTKQERFSASELKPLQKEIIVEETKQKIDFPVYLPDFSLRANSNLKHIAIKGDNIQLLEFMKNMTLKVDIIYIDPPYGTGRSFTYNDKFEDEYKGLKHQAYLNFMRARLELVDHILSPTGTIFISIDDRQFARLKLLCDDIFGEDNAWTLIRNTTSTGANDAKFVRRTHDYVLVYSRSKVFNGTLVPDEDFKFTDKRGKYNLWSKLVATASQSCSASMDFDYEFNDMIFKPVYNGRRTCWLWSKAHFDAAVEHGILVASKNPSRGGGGGAKPQL